MESYDYYNSAKNNYLGKVLDHYITLITLTLTLIVFYANYFLYKNVIFPPQKTLPPKQFLRTPLIIPSRCVRISVINGLRSKLI